MHVRLLLHLVHVVQLRSRRVPNGTYHTPAGRMQVDDLVVGNPRVVQAGEINVVHHPVNFHL